MRVVYKPCSPTWQSGVLAIMRAFHGLPPDIETWSIKEWKHLCKIANQIVEAEFKRGL